MSNDVNTKQNLEKIQNEDSSVLSNSTNTSFSESILQDINVLKSKEIYLISKTFECKIPEILSYLQNESNSTTNKLIIIKYLENLFTKVNFNSEIFSYKYSNDKEKLNLFQIIINQFILCTNDKDDYIRELKGFFTLLMSQISLDKDIYHYIFSFLINYINKCNNNGLINEENNSNLTSEQLSRVLQLLQIYYQSMQSIDEPYNYFYFNGEADSYISIINKENIIMGKKILNLDESLNILFFIKLLPPQVIKQVYSIINYKILDISFNIRSKLISLGIDIDNYLVTNFTTQKLVQLKDSKVISILVKLSLKDYVKTEIFVNNEKVDIPRDIIIKDNDNNKEKLEIKELRFFKNFIGICSNIIIYKENEKDEKYEGLPKFFTVINKGFRRDSKENIFLKSLYLNGFYKEELFSVFLKQELKDKVDDKIIKELNLPIKDKSGENDIKDFLEKNLISIYMPNRLILPNNQYNKTYKNANKIIIKDSINDLDAEFNINSPNLNGAHIHTKFSENFLPLGGLNHFLPIIELMIENEKFLSEENITNFFNLISSVFMPSYLNALKNENNSNFFFNLSYFLEKIPDIYFDNQLACKLISISSYLIYLDKNYANLIQQFHNNILLNEIILFKFKFEEQALILTQIKSFIDCSQRENFGLDIVLIINILLHYDKERYTKFCCKFHSDFFNESCDVHSPELNILLKPLEEIISKLFEKFIKEASQCIDKECETGPQLFKIFEMLTIDISPCLQKIIINQFSNYMKKHFGKYFAFLDKDRQMLDIILFIFKTSIFDIKIDALNLLFLMNKVQVNMNEFYANRSRANSWAFSNDQNCIDEEKAILIQNYILPFYLLGKGILVSSSSSKNSSNDKLSNLMNVDIDKKDENINHNKKIKSEKSIKKLTNKTKKLKNSSIYKIKDNDNDGFNRAITFVGNNNFKVNQNGKKLNYIKVTATQQKIYYNYKKTKINQLISQLYNNIFDSFKEKMGFDYILNLLIKIVSKGDIILIDKFLDDLKKKEKEITEQIYNHHYLFHWLLETSFQTYLIKASNFDAIKFVPGFCIDPIDENSEDKRHIYSEEEKKNKIDEIYFKTNEFIYDIIKNNIYKLDYILTWSKYYYEMRNNKNNFELVRDYVFKILYNSYKLPLEISLLDKKSINTSQKESIYYLNIIFDFLTFYKLSGEQNDEIKKSSQIDEELSRNFPHILLFEFNKAQNESTESNIMRTLNIKWQHFPFYEKIYSFFKPLWTDKKKKEEKDNIYILKKYFGKKNIFNNELELLFYSFNDIQEFQNSFLYANKGIQIINMIFNFFILIFHIGGNESEIKNFFNEFKLFLTLLIISSSTVTITSDIKKQKWPNEVQYKEVQDTTELILCSTLNFFVNRIKELDIFIKKYTKDEETNKLIKYYTYIHQILIENLGYFLQVLCTLYKESSGKFFFKMRTENAIKSGPYILSEKLYSFIEEKDLNNNETNVNFLDNILKTNIKRDSKEINCEFKKNIYLFINSSKIQSFISDYINEDKNKSKLYPFGKYIIKREKLIKNIIPIYDNRINAYQPQKNLCLDPDYFEECYYDKILDVKIGKINKELIKEIFVNQKRIQMEENNKINEYKKIKKKLFSFKGIWSKEDFFYKSQYHLKYKLINHLTEDYSKILLTPILDLDYYIPKFTHFKNEDFFRNPENQIPIYYLVDLSFALKESHKTFINNNNNEKKENSNEKLKPEQNKSNDNNNDDNNMIKSKKTSKKRLNVLFDVKIANYSFNNSNSNGTNEQNFSDLFLFSEYLNKRHSLNSNTNIKVNACLVKTELHISGIFYNNSHEIGFYSYEKNHTNEEEEYDFDRKVCFGSILKSQRHKYYYYSIAIPYSSIKFILKRRYYFKKCALEIFTINNKSYFFRFEENQMKTIFDNISLYMKSDIEDISIEYTKYEEKIGFFNKNIKLNNIFQIPNKAKNMNLKYIYEKWSKWEISTLKFLMLLNFYANRSYNDINQYPVFPWIITDYNENGLASPPNLRPFGVPMGMLDYTEESKERRDDYKATWANYENESIDEDFDRYRSHYSTSLYVTYYLVRVFPFSNMRIELQGKSFDDPNRLFNSLANSYFCALTQKSDVRELIPEFFFFPEMFYNLNKLNLGEIKNRETGLEMPVNDILMPEWTNNDGYIFINKHRTILESPETNDKINEWFNIIFGNKQNGKEAKKIGNLFVRQSYENFEEIYNQSEKKDKVYYCRMVEFGVTPHQIFKNDAYRRLNYSELKSKKNIFSNITEIIKNNEEKSLEISKEIEMKEDNKINNKFLTPFKIFLHQINEEEQEKREIYVLNEEGFITIYNEQQQNSVQLKRILSSKNLDLNFSIENIRLEKKATKKIRKFTDEKQNKINLFLPRYRYNSKKTPSIFFNKGHCIALGGYWNGNILIQNLSFETKNDKNDKNDYPETKIYSTKEFSPIIHMIIDKNEFFAICGNILGTVFIFVIEQKDKTDWHLYKVIYDHFSPICSLSINEKLNIFITCSKSGYCMIYTLPKCKLVNSYNLKNILNNNYLSNNENIILYAHLTLISSSPLPCIIFYFRLINSLIVFSINGHFITEKIIDFEIYPNEIKLFTDQQFIDYLLIVNQKKESIDIYNIIDLKKIMTWPIKNYHFIDFIFTKELDNIIALVNYKEPIEEKENDDENSYKILVLKCANNIKGHFELNTLTPLDEKET